MTRPLFVLVLLWATPVAALDTPSAASEDRPIRPESAAVALDGARTALSEGDPGRAFELARLGRAFDPSRSIEAWELMGTARSEMGEAAAAHRLFGRALVQAEGDERTRLLARMQLARDELGAVVVDVQPGGALLLVDGRPAEPEVGGRVLLLRPGSHRFEARLEGHEGRVTTLHVASGSRSELRIALTPGAEDEPAPVPRPSSRAPGRRWLSGNLILSGIGLGGAIAGGIGARDLSGTSLVDEAHFELGLGLGLALGAQANLLLQSAFDPHGRGDLGVVRLGAVGLLTAAAMSVTVTSVRRCTPQDAECVPAPLAVSRSAGATGALTGIAAATVGNVFLGSDELPVAGGLAASFIYLGAVQSLLAMMTLTRATELRQGARDQLPAAANAMTREADAHEAMAQVTGIVGLGFFALGAGSVVVAAVADTDSLDLTISPGLGSLSVAGTF